LFVLKERDDEQRGNEKQKMVCLDFDGGMAEKGLKGNYPN